METSDIRNVEPVDPDRQKLVLQVFYGHVARQRLEALDADEGERCKTRNQDGRRGRG